MASIGGRPIHELYVMRTAYLPSPVYDAGHLSITLKLQSINTMMSLPIQSTVAAFITVLLWASAFPFIRIALRAFEPVPLAALRFAIAGILMTTWWILRRPRWPTSDDGIRLLVCACIGIALYNILLNTGQQTVPAAAASFVVNTVPVITTLLAVIFLRERVTLWAWVGSLTSFAGVAVIVSGKFGGLQLGLGAGMILLAAICQAGFFILQRPMVAKYGPGTCAAAVVILGALFLSPWLPRAIAQASVASTSQLAAIAILGVFPAAVGYSTWAIAQAYFGPSRAANFLYLVPPLATSLGLVLAGERPSISTLRGGALAVAGVALVNLRGRK
jgi:drug/metabolite transporter (DMT)-like permease